MEPLEGQLMSREKRAKLYFRLMDVVFILALIGFSEFLIDKVFGVILIERSNPIHLPISIFFTTMNFLGPAFLLVARFMRDEYAEQLWQRTIALLAYAVAIAPILLIAGAWIAYALSPEKPVGPYIYLYAKNETTTVISIAWGAYMLLFVAIFQFVRWRDAR
jgi:hypothetical protein